ncbi:hypothetical protein ES692_14205 [Psychroserpens burtonensis]|uniref:DUF1772 domain-containing protein n=1 Tax=Psychroserpens burtonensis TaxID=49278 RepID=A0A5C7BBI6_9FLAO|nr:hypothetical protein [Psychroserpens burtonensis]TXE16066.1 hypothetical protein ES692_14205 [Psychroserpens burtonensis]
MDLERLRVLLDFGLVVLIWIVQLLIYPSFKHFPSNALFKWHSRYTFNMALVVMPLMLGQLSIYTIQIFLEQTLFSICGMLVVLTLWVSTFIQFVPLHQQISDNSFSNKTIDLLVSRNWIRTGLWTGLFISSLVSFF